MKKILVKELKLATSPLAWWFILFSLMTFIPGYPILMGGFFVCMGIFQSTQMYREAGDIIYSALLPIRKRDVVTSKYISAMFFQLTAFLLMVAFTAIRCRLLKDAAAYATNPLLPAGPAFLGGILMIYAFFNLVFMGGFFRTAYYYGKPFIFFIVVAMLVIALYEALWRFVGAWVLFSMGFVAYPVLTFVSLRLSQRNFEEIDL